MSSGNTAGAAERELVTAIADKPRSGLSIPWFMENLLFIDTSTIYNSITITCDQFDEGCSETSAIPEIRYYDEGACVRKLDLRELSAQVANSIWDSYSTAANATVNFVRLRGDLRSLKVANYLSGANAGGGFAIELNFFLSVTSDLCFGCQIVRV